MHADAKWEGNLRKRIISPSSPAKFAPKLSPESRSNHGGVMKLMPYITFYYICCIGLTSYLHHLSNLPFFFISNLYIIHENIPLSEVQTGGGQLDITQPGNSILIFWKEKAFSLNFFFISKSFALILTLFPCFWYNKEKKATFTLYLNNLLEGCNFPMTWSVRLSVGLSVIIS